MSTNVKILIDTRKYICSQITRGSNKIKSTNPDTLTKTDRLQLLTKLESLQKDIKPLDKQIAELLYDENDTSAFDIELPEADRYQDTLITAISTMKISINQNDITPTTPATAAAGPVNRVKLAELPLPEYSRKEGKNFNTFLQNFESVIQNYSLKEYEKFLYLKKQLKNESLTLVDSLEVNDQAYTIAKQLLADALASPLQQNMML